MAKKQTVNPRLFDKTEAPQQEEKKKKGKPKPYGIYLNIPMAADLEKIAAAETDGNFHALLQYAVKYFIREYKAGRVKIKKTTQTKLEL